MAFGNHLIINKMLDRMRTSLIGDICLISVTLTAATVIVIFDVYTLTAGTI